LYNKIEYTMNGTYISPTGMFGDASQQQHINATIFNARGINDIFEWRPNTAESDIWSVILFIVLLAAFCCTLLVILRFVICGPSSYIKRRAVAPMPLPEARIVVADDELSAYSFDDDFFMMVENNHPHHDEEMPPPMIAIAERSPPMAIVRVL
jgi:hypothetical protein